MLENNLLKILGVHDREDTFTNLLAFCFNNSDKFQNLFIKFISNNSLKLNSTAKAYTRISTSKSGVPDLIITCKDNHSDTLIILENKLKADEGKDQTDKYGSNECRDDLVKRFRLNSDHLKTHCYFLTLFPDQRPANETFTPVTYENLIIELNLFSGEKNELVRQLTDNLIELLTLFYDQGRLQPEDIVLEKLEDSEGMDGGFLYFTNLLNSLNLPQTLKPKEFSKNSKTGRRYYLTQLIKPNWAPEEIKASNRGLDYKSFDPSKHFNIHIEPQFSPLNNRFDIFLHFETNPYLPVKEARQYLDPIKYKEYLEIRSNFSEKIKLADIKAFRVGGRSNQIGKAIIDIGGKNLSQAQGCLKNTISNIAHAVDKIIEK